MELMKMIAMAAVGASWLLLALSTVVLARAFYLHRKWRRWMRALEEAMTQIVALKAVEWLHEDGVLRPDEGSDAVKNAVERWTGVLHGEGSDE